MKTKLLILISITFLFTTSLQAQTSEFWGMTSRGGAHNAGCIFKTDTTGQNQSVVYSWFKYDGNTPTYTRLCEAANGKLYGMTQSGGILNYGVLFEFDPATNAYTVKVLFDKTNNGRVPYSSLIEAADGKLYGMTRFGGTNDHGVIFSYDTGSGVFTKLFEFDGTNGSRPSGSLVQAANGKMYGLTDEGGISNLGVLFEFDPATTTFTKKLDFDGANNGEHPLGSMIEAGNGKLYGTANRGGSNNEGVLFSYDPATDIYTKIRDFEAASGKNPRGLMQASNGKIYGMTKYGGAVDHGVLFEFDPATGTYVKKLDLDSNIGGQPSGSFIELPGGKLYGLTKIGGAFGGGTLVVYDTESGVLTNIMDFEDTAKGKNPLGSLTEATNGKLYGMTNRGGTAHNGTLFEFETGTNSFVKILDFNEPVNGSEPYGSLLQANNGKLYGVTETGGTALYGVLFAFDPFTSTYTKLLDFNWENGGTSTGNLIQADNGKLYGMASEGGANDYGVLFSYDLSTSTYTVILDFDGDNNGAYPYGSLLQANDGMLYGLVYEGGLNGVGVLYTYDPATDTYTKKLDFSEEDGRFPYGELIQAENGKLYGLTSSGGAHSSGVLFEFDPATDTYVRKVDFNQDDDDGRLPQGSLVEAQNGKLYGVTYRGGINSDGTLFEFDPATGIYTKKVDFESTATGADPYGSLLEGADGRLYGTTVAGGIYGNGALFAYDPVSNTITKTLDFDISNGNKPFGNLIRVSLVIDKVNEPPFAQDIRVYPVPSSGAVSLDLGTDYRNMQINVRTADGRLVNSYGTPADEHITLNIEGSAGIYFIEIISPEEKAVYKVVKQ